MAVREILVYPQHKAELRRRSEPVSGFGRPARRLIRDLKDTLQANPDGVGLAAPQINVHLRAVIVCSGSEMDGKWRAGPPVALVNPLIIEAGDERKDFDGCLSFPGLYGETKRPHHLRVTGLDEEGQPFHRVFDGFNAVLVHHEIDHLDGVLFIDLGGEPTSMPKEFAKPEGLKAMLELDLEMERQDVENYTKHAQMAGGLGLIELQMKLEEMAACPGTPFLSGFLHADVS